MCPKRLLFVSHEMTLSGAPIQLAYLVQWLRKHSWGTSSGRSDALRAAAVSYSFMLDHLELAGK